jgi:hypothetical protein
MKSCVFCGRSANEDGCSYCGHGYVKEGDRYYEKLDEILECYWDGVLNQKETIYRITDLVIKYPYETALNLFLRRNN